MRTYWEAFLGAYRRQLRNRGGLVFTAAFYTVLIVAWSAIWWAATRASGGDISGYRIENLVWYMVATEAAVIVVPGKQIEIIGEQIAAGDIETEMLRPSSVVGIRVAMEIGHSVARLSVICVFGLILGLLYARQVPNLAALVLAVPSLALASSCNVAATHAFGSLSFWLRDSKAAWFLFQKLVFLPGGMLLPIQLMPHWLATVAWSTPFWTMAYAPGRLASGSFEPLLLVGQCLWFGALFAAASGLFALGQRRVQQGLV